MRKPVVAIVGTPNVGKSTFFNKIAGRRISIVDDQPGVTRDRIYADAEWNGYAFSIVDTGGLDFSKDDEMYRSILSQAQIAIDLADVIVFFVDGKKGITQGDLEVANMLRKCKAPKIVAVNKLDNFEIDKTYEFYELKLGDPMPLSASHGKGIGDLLDAIVDKIEQISPDEEDKALKIAIVGKPNAGKSSLTNRLIGEDRMVVSNVAGTTRDAIDIPFRYNGKNYTLIDTAGLRKKGKIAPDSIERYSALRSIDAVERCDIALLVIDATEGITEQDSKVAGLMHEEGKPSVIVVNKWDKIDKTKMSTEKFKRLIETELPFMKYYVPVFISCESGQRIGKVMEAVEQVYENAGREITMGVFNSVLQNATAVTEPPIHNGRKLKVIYGKQSSTYPPRFTIFCNRANLMDFSYSRYLENSIRNAFDFKGTPIKLEFKNKGEND